jgi:hypothetical protein
MSEDRYIELSHAQWIVSTLEELCKLALVEDVGLTSDKAADRLQQELDYYRHLRIEEHSVGDIFHRFCMSLANRDRLWNLIYGNRFGELDSKYGSILAQYEPEAVVLKYQNQVDRLLSDFLEARQLPPDRSEYQRTSPRGQFRLYTRGILAGAKFFAEFKDGMAFKRSLHEWLTGPEKAAQLPYHFHNLGFPGFGPALASDFLKEIGIKEFGKPDRWVYRCMKAAGWVTDASSEADVQRVFWELWRILGDSYPPVVTDKLMFLVGSGSFVMVEPMYSCRSRYEAFEEAMNDKSHDVGDQRQKERVK